MPLFTTTTLLADNPLITGFITFGPVVIALTPGTSVIFPMILSEVFRINSLWLMTDICIGCLFTLVALLIPVTITSCPSMMTGDKDQSFTVLPFILTVLERVEKPAYLTSIKN